MVQRILAVFLCRRILPGRVFPYKCPSPFQVLQGWLCRWESQSHQKSSGKDQEQKESNFSPNWVILRRLYPWPEVYLHKIPCRHLWAAGTAVIHHIHGGCAPSLSTNTLGKITLFSRLPPLNPNLRLPNFGKHVTTSFSFGFFFFFPLYPKRE